MMRLRVTSGTFLVVLAACSDSTKPVTPVAVASMALAPESTPLLKGSQVRLTLTVTDSAANPVSGVPAAWTSSTPTVARVSSDGVVSGINYGSATIVATIGTHSTSATVVVTSAPTSRSYSVIDLGGGFFPGNFERRMSDSGDVLAIPNATVYRHGIATPITGCTLGVSINGPGHVLCRVSSYDSVSSYAIWRDGHLAPLAAPGVFTASYFRAFALTDSDVVVGSFNAPSFPSTSCPPPGIGCLSLWKDGQPIFPSFSVGSNFVKLANNRQQFVMEAGGWLIDTPMTATFNDITTGKFRTVPYGVNALNDNGWIAIRELFFHHGTPASTEYTAALSTPDTLIVFGPGSASGINNANVVVGTLSIGPFIWRGDGGVSLLTDAAADAAWTITAADEINNRGQILAGADNVDGRKNHMVILTPTQP